MNIGLRKYNACDFEEIAELFYNTVHGVNCRDYSKKQLQVWATGKLDFNRWNNSLLKNYALVAIIKGEIVGFGDISSEGYLDRLYVHKDYQNMGIATAICDELESHVYGDKICVHASITAKTFFEKRGYNVLKENQVELNGILLTNYIMEKLLQKRGRI